MHFAMANSPESGMHSAVALIVSCRECTARERIAKRGAPTAWNAHGRIIQSSIFFLKSLIVSFVLSTEQFLRFRGIDPVRNVQAKPLGEVLLERYPLSFVLHRFGPGANAK